MNSIGTKGYIALAIIVGLLAIGLVSLVWVVRPSATPNDKGQTSSEQLMTDEVQAKDTSSSVVPESYEPEGVVAASNIKGLAESTLDPKFKEELPGLLTWYFANEGDVSQLVFNIQEAGDVDKDYKAYKLTNENTGVTYDLFAGTSLRIYRAEEDKNPASPSAGGTGDAQQAAHEETHDLAQQNVYDEIHSSQTPFDTLNSWALDDTEKIKEILPDAVSSRLFPDLDEQLSQRGANVTGPIDVMVSEDVKHENGNIIFMVMAYSGNNQIIVECTYAEDGSSYEMRLMP